jgi:hypothetical protein
MRRNRRTAGGAMQDGKPFFGLLPAACFFSVSTASYRQQRLPDAGPKPHALPPSQWALEWQAKAIFA